MRRFILAALVLALMAGVMGAVLCMSSCMQQTPATQDADGDEAGEFTGPIYWEIDYSSGIHHAEMRIVGYEDPITIEVYSHTAPMTAKTFAALAQSKYYDGKPLYLILSGMYVRGGSTVQDNDNLIRGEFEESDISNSNSLKRGTIALNRAEDGQQSDASSFIIFLSDMSYLDGKYAGFGKITEGMDVIDDLCERTTDKGARDYIPVDESGEIELEEDCPKIETIRMID